MNVCECALRSDCKSDVIVFLVPPGFQLTNDRPPIEAEITLDDDSWVGQLPRKQSEAIIEACEMRGFQYNPRRLYCELYTFVRENPPSDPQCLWDSDAKLQTTVALSRLIHPTPVCFRHSATVKTNQAGEIVTIEPVIVSGPGSHAYVAETANAWLTPDDAKKLAALLTAYNINALPERVKTALWHHDYAAWHYEGNARWLFVATGLEALIHTRPPKGRTPTTWQFEDRIPTLAVETGAGPVTTAEASEMYNLRSELTHGGHMSKVNAQHSPLYCKMENLLRQTILKALSDPQFASIFKDGAEIDKRWPVDFEKRKKRPKATTTLCSGNVPDKKR